MVNPLYEYITHSGQMNNTLTIKCQKYCRLRSTTLAQTESTLSVIHKKAIIDFAFHLSKLNFIEITPPLTNEIHCKKLDVNLKTV